MEKKLTEKILEENGYKLINSPLGKDYERWFQKRFRDENGSTKYFIEVVHTIMDRHEGYHFEIQLNPNGYDTINIETVQWFNDDQKYSTMTLEKAEELFERIFKLLNCKSYD